MNHSHKTACYRRKRKLWWIIPLVFVLLIGILLLIYPSLFKSYLKSKIAKLEEKYQLEIVIDSIQFDQSHQLKLCHCFVLSADDTIFYFNELQGEVTFFLGRKLSPHFKELTLDQAVINYAKNNDRERLLEDSLQTKKTTFDWLNSAYATFSTLFPDKMTVGSVSLQLLVDSLPTEYKLTNLFIDIIQSENECHWIRTSGEFRNCTLFHPRVSQEEIIIDSASFLLNLQINREKLQVLDNSVLTINGFSIHPDFLFEKTEKYRIALAVDEQNIDVASFFKAFPPGVFQRLSKMKIDGEFSFNFEFDCDFADVDNLKFDFNISSSELKIPLASKSFITRVNSDFEYLCYEDGKEVKQILVSPQNPHFVPFEKIPFYLQYAILVSEDPSFYRHKGFVKSAIKDALIVDIQRGSYARGGSTITMQLVKNLFLNKEKLISRKFEEVLLTSIIEDMSLISKERMFEIYVNIIEWGPMVYGIYEAAAFYFNKTPDLLTFGECVYLATLIRSPKQYAGTIDHEGKVTPARRSEMHLIARKMLERNMITQNQYSRFNSFVLVQQ